MSDTQIPAVNEIIDHAEKAERTSRPIQKDKIKFLNTDNTWNKDGILAAYDETEDDMTYCSASGAPLFYISRDGRKFNLESHGYCAANGKPYHRDHLKMSEDASRTSYPIVYQGFYSLEEYAKPLSPEELAEIRKKYGI